MKSEGGIVNTKHLLDEQTITKIKITPNKSLPKSPSTCITYQHFILYLLGSMYCARHFIGIESFHSHNKSLRYKVLLYTLCIWETEAQRDSVTCPRSHSWWREGHDLTQESPSRVQARNCYILLPMQDTVWAPKPRSQFLVHTQVQEFILALYALLFMNNTHPVPAACTSNTLMFCCFSSSVPIPLLPFCPKESYQAQLPSHFLHTEAATY